MLSIDVGNKNLHIVQGKYAGNKLEITSGLIVAIPQEAIGESVFSRPDELSRFVSDLLKVNRIKSREIILTINTSNAIIRDFELPDSKPQELTAMVKNEMEQVAAGGLNSIVDYRLLTPVRNGQKVKVRAASIRKEIVENAYKFVTNIKLKPISLDVHFNAITKLFTDSTEINGNVYGTDNSALLVDYGNTSTSLYILTVGGIDLMRSIQIGGKQLNLILSKNKEALGNNIDTSDFMGSEQDKAMLNRWADELYKVVQYFNTRSSNSSIKSVFLFGGNSDAEGLIEYVSNMFSINCDVIKSIDKIKQTKKLNEIPFKMLVNAIGAMVKI